MKNGKRPKEKNNAFFFPGSELLIIYVTSEVD